MEFHYRVFVTKSNFLLQTKKQLSTADKKAFGINVHLKVIIWRYNTVLNTSEIYVT